MVLVEHHIKYKEIHGADETIWIEQGEHLRLHRRLRKEGKCNIPVEELTIISRRANGRTEKTKSRKRAKATHKTPARRQYMQNINKTPHIKASKRRYAELAQQRIEVSEGVGENVRLKAYIMYNKLTGTVTYSARFEGTNGRNIHEVNLL